MSFCPDCRYEYEPGISKCPDCGSELVDKLPQESVETHSMESGEEINFVPLKNLPSRLYAEMLKEALKGEGIVCMIKGDEGVFLRMNTIPVPISQITIWVPQKDLEKAREIADQMLDHI